MRDVEWPSILESKATTNANAPISIYIAVERETPIVSSINLG